MFVMLMSRLVFSDCFPDFIHINQGVRLFNRRFNLSIPKESLII